MKGKLITIIAQMAHFKNSRSGLLQQSYTLPPVSTVVGVIKNIYGEDIENFIFGYNFQYTNSEYEIMTIYKEVNLNVKTETDKDRFNTYPAQIEYLINPRLEIVVIGLTDNYKLNTTLNLGKTDCLARLRIKDIEIAKEKCIIQNVLTEIKHGDGIINRYNMETWYNEQKGLFDYDTRLLRLNDEYECDYSYNEKGIYLWKYNKRGDIEWYNEQK